MLHGIIPHMLGPVGGGGLRPQDVFATSLYTGNGTTQTITTGIDMTVDGGLNWIKNRTFSPSDHNLCDTIRGGDNLLISNRTGANVPIPEPYEFTSFNSDGFTVGQLWANQYGVNKSGDAQVAWSFRCAAKFFDQKQVTHTNGVATNIDLSSLGVIGFALAKITNTTGDWLAWHRSLTAGNNLRLNTTGAQTTTNAWLSVSGATLTISASAPSGNYMIYGWAHDPDPSGIVQCGAFNGGVAVNLGWKPQYALTKLTDFSQDWEIADQARGWSAGDDKLLKPNDSAVELSSARGEPTSQGFTTTSFSGGLSYIYLAIREPSL